MNRPRLAIMTRSGMGHLAFPVTAVPVCLLYRLRDIADRVLWLEDGHLSDGNGRLAPPVSVQLSAPLVVEAVSTSCGCTKATLEPMTISPGGTATLHIEFDSGAHGPELTGAFTRQVYIASNDPAQPEAPIEFTANILPESTP